MINHHVGIPGVGSFSIEKKSASFDFIGKLFHPPAFNIIFSHDGLAAERKFYSFLASEKNINDVQAVQLYNEFAFSLKNNIQNEQSVDLPGIGSLQRLDDGNLDFTPALQKKYLPDVSASQIIPKTNKEHYITVGDQQRTNTQQMQEWMEPEETAKGKQYWWIYALVLGLLAIAAIIYYYQANGTLR